MPPCLTAASVHDLIDALVPEEYPRCSAFRRQCAVVRALAEQLEHAALADAIALRAQIVEELTRLGHRRLEAVAGLAKAMDAAPGSGVLPLYVEEIAAAS